MKAIDGTLPESLLARYSEFVTARIGLHYPPERWADLERATRQAAKDLGFDDLKSCVEQLLLQPQSATQVEVLASHLTVGETYFFRDRAAFDALELRVLPELIASRRASARRLRIWSAGCCTGEEAYSIAILLAKLIPDLHAWNILILATDINPHFLGKASRGIYTDWSFRDTPRGVREGFFKRTKQGSEIASRIKALVTFKYHNLVQDTYPSVDTDTNAMDIIFCRNVLMYFKRARGEQLIEQLASSLLEGGWLFVSPIETPRVVFKQLAEVKFPGAIGYRKRGITATVAEQTLPLMPSTAASSSHSSSSGFGSAPRTSTEQESELPAPRVHPRRDDDSIGSAADFIASPGAEAQATPGQEAADLYRQGRYAEAAERLQQTLEVGSTDSAVMALLARICANQGRFVEAARWCTRAAEADKLNPQWCYLLATILQEEGQLEAAIAALKRALYLDPNHAMAHFALGNATRKQGRLKESERHFRNAQTVLNSLEPKQILPESDGITAGRLAEIIASTTELWRSQ